MAQPQQTSAAPAGFGDRAVAHDMPVLDTTIHWVESGSGDPMVFIHGNPTNSYLWRHVFAGLNDGSRRLLAVDLVGYGQSGKPDIDYALADHVRYLTAWFDELDLRDVTLVLQDYGATFGLAWAREHADRVKAVVLMEPAAVQVLKSDELPPEYVAFLEGSRTPEGERQIIEDNLIVATLLPQMVLTGLSDEDHQHYLAPFPTPESRRPQAVSPRVMPVDDYTPAETMAMIEPNAAWLASSQTPKLLLTFEPGFLLTRSTLAWFTSEVPQLTIVPIEGQGLHWVQEEQPRGIIEAMKAWLPTVERSRAS